MENKAQIKGKNSILFVAAFASFITPFMGSSINVALPSIGAFFDATAIQLTWVATAFLLSSAVFLVPLGRLSDIIGRKKIFQYGLAVFTLSTLLCVFSPSIEWLIVFRVLQGAGSAMIFGTALAIVTSIFQKGDRGKAVGITISAVYLGLTMGPLIGGVLTQQLGWQSIFWIIIPLGLVAIWLSYRNIQQEWKEAQNERFDWKGSLLFGVSIVSLMLGFSWLPEIHGYIFVFTGLLGITGFIFYEKTLLSPVMNMALFQENRIFAFSNFAALINYSATFAISFMLSLYLQYLKDFNPQEAGLILGIQPVLMAIMSPFAGRLSDRIDPGKVASVGMAIIAVGLIIISFLQATSPLWLIMILLFMFGIGYAFFSSPNTNAIMSSVEKKYYGLASGTVGTMRLVGQMLSMGIATLLFAIFIGSDKIAPSNYPDFMLSLKTAFQIFGFLCIIGIYFSLARGKSS